MFGWSYVESDTTKTAAEGGDVLSQTGLSSTYPSPAMQHPLLQRSLDVDVLSNSTLLSPVYCPLELNVTHQALDYRSDLLNTTSSAIHSTKKHRYHNGNSVSGIFHSRDVMGSNQISFNMATVPRVADQVFPEQKWGGYTIPNNLAHYGSTIRIPHTRTYCTQKSPMDTHTSARSALTFSKWGSPVETAPGVQLSAFERTKSMLQGASGLTTEPEELEVHVFDMAQPKVTKFARDVFVYPALNLPALNPIKLSGPLRDVNSNNLARAINTLGVNSNESTTAMSK